MTIKIFLTPFSKYAVQSRKKLYSTSSKYYHFFNDSNSIYCPLNRKGRNEYLSWGNGIATKGKNPNAYGKLIMQP